MERIGSGMEKFGSGMFFPDPTLTLSIGADANEGQVRIKYNYLVPIYVFPEMNLAASLFPKHKV
jgi:hypothetical protein